MAILVEIFDPKENKIGTVPSKNLGAALEKGYQYIMQERKLKYLILILKKMAQFLLKTYLWL